MAKNRKPSKLDRMVDAFDETILDILEHGEPAMKNGEPILDSDDKPIRIPPSAAFLNVARHRIGQLQQARGLSDEAEEMGLDVLARQAAERGDLPPVDQESDDPATG